MDQALSDHGYDEIPLPATLGGDERIEAEFSQGAQDGFHVTVGQSLLGAKEILRRDQRFIAQQAAQGFYFFLGPVGEVGQGALVGFVALAPALAEEDGGRGIAVGDGFDVHGTTIHKYLRKSSTILHVTWEHLT